MGFKVRFGSSTCHPCHRPYRYYEKIPQVSSVELERACLNALPEVLSEAAAIAVPEAGGGPDQLIIFAVPKGSLGALDVDEIKAGCQRHIRTEINPLFKLQKVGQSAQY